MYIGLYLEWSCYNRLYWLFYGVYFVELQLIEDIFFYNKLTCSSRLVRNHYTPIFEQSSNLSSLPCSLSEILSWSILTQFEIYNIYDDEVKERRYLKKLASYVYFVDKIIINQKFSSIQIGYNLSRNLHRKLYQNYDQLKFSSIFSTRIYDALRRICLLKGN